ncbi:MAG: precorrin-6y C5,15-methyltransferase (decarboxylating) subunit CbiE [Nitrospirae bacterium]|nr:precorrin-6y C5,15-methyltransferase (decarboxylating) subunit CbiE [Nitrospirota bacterium]
MSIVYVIGIGFKPLDIKASEAILRSSYVYASPRLMEVFPLYREYDSVKERIVVLDSVDATIDSIRLELDKYEDAEVALLASGDPVFFGIGSRAVEEYGSNRVKIMPDMTSMQNAFSRINESWDTALFVSLHGGPYPGRRRKMHYSISDIPVLLERQSKIGILTDRDNNPQEIAENIIKTMPQERYKNLTMCVFEKIGYPEEKITKVSVEKAALYKFSEPNIVILLNPYASEAGSFSDQVKYGYSRNEIEHLNCIMPNDEARALAIHKLRLLNSGVMYDIGAGSGDVSIDAAGISAGMKIYAIEKRSDHADICRKNRARFNSLSVEVVEAEAPECLDSLPVPDRVFIGCKNADSIIDAICSRSSPLFVIRVNDQDSVVQTVAALQKNGYSTEVVSLTVTYANGQPGITKPAASNFSVIIKGEFR